LANRRRQRRIRSPSSGQREMKWFLGIIVAIAAVVSLYKFRYPTYTYRYRRRQNGRCRETRIHRWTTTSEFGGRISSADQRSASSQYAVATGLAVLALAIISFFAASLSYAQSVRSKTARVSLPDVALLVHGPFGEDSYNLMGVADDSVTLEESSDRRMRLQIRRIPDKRCVFVSTRELDDGLDVVQLDFTKFDGAYQLLEACGGSEPTSALSENRCTYSLRFDSDEQAFCEFRFLKPDFDLGKIPFPAGACQHYALGAREKKFYTKYIDAYERIKSTCGSGQ
jgi:hypothetical protein